jgi:hypothetical protein
MLPTPVPGIVEKQVADGAFGFVRKLFTRYGELKKENAALHEQLRENAALEKLKKENAALQAQLDGKAAFERKLATLEMRPKDDNIYWAKDGSGAAFCPLCISGPEKLFTPLTHGMSEGSYYCRLHTHYFETEERRVRVRNHRPRPRNWHDLRRQLEAESRDAGPQDWMAR